MVRAVAPVAALLLSVGLLLMGNGLQGTLLPLRAALEDFSSVEIGLLGSSYFLGFAVGCFFGSHLIRRVGHIRTFTAMVAIASSVVLAHSLILSPLAWWLLRMATGVCFAVLYMVIESWLNEKASNETRGLVFSVYTVVNLTVITLGQLMLILGRPDDFMLFMLASILVSVAAVPVALTRAESPRPIETVRIRFMHLYRLSPVGVVGCIAVGLSNGAFWALGPIFASSDERNVADVALFMSIAVIAGAIGQWPLGLASDRMDRRRVIILACLGAAMAGVAMALFFQAWDRAILVLVFFYGLFAFPLYSICVAHMNDFVEADGYVEASSGLLLMFGLGAVAGPLIASAVIQSWGAQSLFMYTAWVHVATAAFAVHRMRRRAPVPLEERVSFNDALRVAQTVSTVDPLHDAPAEWPGAARPTADGRRPGKG